MARPADMRINIVLIHASSVLSMARSTVGLFPLLLFFLLVFHQDYTNKFKLEGRNINSKIDLQWQIASEENFSHSDIEKSTNGRDFYSIGRKSGQNRIRG